MDKTSLKTICEVQKKLQFLIERSRYNIQELSKLAGFYSVASIQVILKWDESQTHMAATIELWANRIKPIITALYEKEFSSSNIG